MESVLSGKFEEINFISEFDRTSQKYLIMKSKEIPARGIVIFLHGATHHCQQGFDSLIFNGSFARIKNFLYQRNYVYVSPEYRGDSWMNQAAEYDLRQLIGILNSDFRTDRTFVIGGSMGGTASLIFSCRNNHLVSGVLALCPATDMKKLYFQWAGTGRDFLARTIESAYGGTPETNPYEYEKRSVINHIECFRGKNVAIIHGTADDLIPVSHSRNFVRKAINSGIRIFYQEIKNGDHDSPIKDYTIVEKALLWLMFSQEQSEK